LVDVVKQANEIVASFNTPLPPSDDESNKSSIYAWVANSQQQRRRYDSDEAGKGPTSSAEALVRATAQEGSLFTLHQRQSR
jgi:hypothetical protein